MNGKYLKTFKRHDLVYADSMIGKKIFTRNVFLNDKIIYHYPVQQSELPKSDLRLLSGNDHLTREFVDTILIDNKALPIMNRTIHVKGAVISRTSDSTYLIKVNDRQLSKATLYVTASDNYEEIKGRVSFISDSLVMLIK